MDASSSFDESASQKVRAQQARCTRGTIVATPDPHKGGATAWHVETTAIRISRGWRNPQAWTLVRARWGAEARARLPAVRPAAADRASRPARAAAAAASRPGDRASARVHAKALQDRVRPRVAAEDRAKPPAEGRAARRQRRASPPAGRDPRPAGAAPGAASPKDRAGIDRTRRRVIMDGECATAFPVSDAYSLERS
jgi:hypothetical protein